MGRIIDTMDMPAAEALVVLASEVCDRAPAATVGVLRHWLGNGQIERVELEDALSIALGAFELRGSGGNGWEAEDGPNMGQAVVVLSRVLR